VRSKISLKLEAKFSELNSGQKKSQGLHSRDRRIELWRKEIKRILLITSFQAGQQFYSSVYFYMAGLNLIYQEIQISSVFRYFWLEKPHQTRVRFKKRKFLFPSF